MSRRRGPRTPPPTTDRRTPEERIEAMVREPNRERAQRMLVRIRDDLDARPEPAAWIAAARTLSERLIISFDAFYYFAELFTECLLFVASRSDPELARLHSELEAIERAHGLRDGEAFDVDDAPEDWGPLNAAWARRARELQASWFRELGHDDVAKLYEENPEEFERRADRGRIDLWGSDDELDSDEV